MGAALLGYVGQLALLVALWGTIGTRAVAASSLGGGGWGWIALIALLAAVRLASSRAAGRLAIDAGAVLRDRILHGLLRLDTEPLRAAGIGRLMGRVADVEAVESLALGGGLTAAVGIFELVTGLCVLAVGVAPVGELAFAGSLGDCSPPRSRCACSGRSGPGRPSGWRSRTISSNAWSGSGRWSRSSRASCGTATRTARSPSIRREAARSIARSPR